MQPPVYQQNIPLVDIMKRQVKYCLPLRVMTPSAELFELIKSLTPNEKRYFKLFASKHTIGEANKYVKLFDAIDDQDEYDEEKIKKVFKNDAFVTHLSAKKNYLYNEILDCLLVYNLSQSTENELRKNLMISDSLFKKGLYDHFEKLLKKTKEKAIETESFLIAYEVIKRERRLLSVRSYHNVSDEDFEQLLHQEKELMEKELNVDAYTKLSGKLSFIKFRYGNVRDQQLFAKMKAVIDDPLMQQESNALSRRAKRFFHYMHSIYCMDALNDIGKAYTHTEKLVALIGQSLKLKQEPPENYVITLNNHIVNCVLLKKFDEAVEKARSIRNIAKDFECELSPSLEALSTIMSYDKEIYALTEKGDFEQGVAQLEEMDSVLKKYETKVSKSSRVSIKYNLASLCYGAGKNKEALKYLNDILNENLDANTDIVCFSRILNLVIHLEMENHELISYVYKATYRFLLKRNRVYKAETIFITLLKDLSKELDESKYPGIYKKALAEFEKIKDDAFEKNVYKYFDFSSWLTSRITRKSFGEVIKGKGA